MTLFRDRFFRVSLAVGWLVTGLVMAIPAAAEPSLERPEPLLWSLDRSAAWQLYPDRTDPSLYYRLPRLFTLVYDGESHPMAYPERTADGALRLTFYWSGEADEDSAFRAAFTGRYGPQARFVAPVPEAINVEAPPEIAEQHGGDVNFGELSVLPGAVMQGTVTIPAASEDAFRHYAVGTGYSGLVTLSYYFSTPDQGTVLMPYATALLLRVPLACTLRPELPC